MTKNKIEEVEIVKHHSSLYLKNRGGRTGSRAQHQTEVERDESGRSQSGWDRPWKASAMVSVCQERFVSRLRSQSGSNTAGFLSAQTDIQRCLSAPSVCSWWFCCWTFPHKSWPDVALYKAANLVQMPLIFRENESKFLSHEPFSDFQHVSCTWNGSYEALSLSQIWVVSMSWWIDFEIHLNVRFIVYVCDIITFIFLLKCVLKL